MFTSEIKKSLLLVLKELELGISEEEITLEHPALLVHGDYSTNIALKLQLSSRTERSVVEGSLSFMEKKEIPPCALLSRNDSKLNPQETANLIINKWQEKGWPDFIEKVEVAGAGFINIWLKFDALGKQLISVLSDGDNYGQNFSLKDKKIMVEFAHPNTHKELHIGHMRTLITGEALARLFSACGSNVFRANYQGDIGPHVAKAIWGTEKLLKERNISWEEAEKLSLPEKAHLLGEGYVRGNQDYEKFDKEIDELNGQLYNKDPQIMAVYDRTRRWSLDYYDAFYTRFLTKFDQLFFESQVAEAGKKIILDNVGKIFEKSEGAVIFDGEPYGLHKRVFITANGTPTYEAKEMALSQAQFSAFPFDLNVHVVANEQSGYFKVVIEAIEQLFPELKGKEYHLPMGMVNLIGRKMSSRTGVILKVDDLLAEVKALLEPLIKLENISGEEKAHIAETGTIGAVKYSILRVGPKADVAFDPQKSVSLQGDSGIYIEYTFARTQSVLAKSKFQISNFKINPNFKFLNDEEIELLRTFYRFGEVVEEAAKQFSPNILCNFLFDLASKFNLFYDKQKIIGSENEEFRLALTAGVGQVLKNGLNLLGIEALEKM